MCTTYLYHELFTILVHVPLVPFRNIALICDAIVAVYVAIAQVDVAFALLCLQCAYYELLLHLLGSGWVVVAAAIPPSHWLLQLPSPPPHECVGVAAAMGVATARGVAAATGVAPAATAMGVAPAATAVAGPEVDPAATAEAASAPVATAAEGELLGPHYAEMVPSAGW